VQTAGARFSRLPFASGRIKRKLIPIYDEGTIDRDLVREGQRNIMNFFQERGYFDAQVKTDFKREPDKISLTYVISKGSKHKVEDVSLAGNQNLSDGDLKPAIGVKQKHFLSRGKFSEKLLRQSASAIQALYHNAGYEELQVHPEVVDHEPELDVTFQIIEGPRTVVENLGLRGNDTLARGVLQPPNGFNLHPGASFSPKKMADDRSHILAAYLDRGYLNADVQSTVTRHQDDPHKVDVTYNITEHQQVRVSEVVTLGEKVTRKSLIGKVANIYPESPLSQGRLLAGESELYNLGVFDWANVGPRKPISDQTDEEAVIKVHEAKRNTITYGFGLEIAKRGGNVPAGTLAVPGLPPIGIGTSVKFHGQVPLRSGAPMTLAAQGNVDVRLLRLLSPDLRTSGIVALDVRGAGNVTHPTVEGTIRLQKVNLATVSAPIGLEQVDGALTIANDRLQINQLNGQLGGGQIAAGGFVALRPQLEISLAVNAKSIRLRYPEGMRAILDSNLTFSATEAATLDGRVLVDSLSFTQDFDLANFIGQYSGSSVPSAGNSLADKIKMNVAIQSAEQLAATSSEVSIEGSANLRLIGTAGNPVIVGRADLTSGEIFFMKKRYQLERGVNFTDPNRTNPVLNMLITTVVKQYNISLTVIGPIDNLRTSYVSDPPLPPVDIINLIARGQTTEEATPSNLGANSVLAQGLASQVSGQVEKLAGLSSLQIDPLLGGNNTNPSARVAIQQRVTKSFQFTFSTDLTSAQNEVVQGEYQLNKRWSMSVTRDESGGFAKMGNFTPIFERTSVEF
jgi:hypothetical protein